MKNILYVIPNGHLGGAERLTELLIKYHNRNKFNPTVAFLRDGPLVERIAKMGVKVKLMPLVRMRNIHQHHLVIKALEKMIQQENISLVHSSMSYAHFFAAQAAKNSKKPSVWFQHGPVGAFDIVCNLFPTAGIFTNSKITSLDQKKKTWRKFPIIQIDPGVELPQLTPENKSQLRGELRKKLGLSSKDFVFGFVGRFQGWKGQLQFVNAFALAQEKNSQLKAIFVGASDLGDRDYEAQVRGRAQELGLVDKINFMGFQESMERLYPAFDSLVHASVGAEPFGLVIAEAMAHGLPVIASRRGTPGQIITDQVTGYLIDPDEPLSFSQALLEVSTQTNKIQSMASNGKQFVEKYFSAEHFLAQVESEYEKILKT